VVGAEGLVERWDSKWDMEPIDKPYHHPIIIISPLSSPFHALPTAPKLTLPYDQAPTAASSTSPTRSSNASAARTNPSPPARQ
jgi:hypothetical protein